MAGTCECGNVPSGSTKRGVNPALAAKLLASQERTLLHGVNTSSKSCGFIYRVSIKSFLVFL
jgi:hypothetical protein